MQLWIRWSFETVILRGSNLIHDFFDNLSGTDCKSNQIMLTILTIIATFIHSLAKKISSWARITQYEILWSSEKFGSLINVKIMMTNERERESEWFNSSLYLIMITNHVCGWILSEFFMSTIVHMCDMIWYVHFRSISVRAPLFAFILSLLLLPYIQYALFLSFNQEAQTIIIMLMIETH